MRLQLIVPLKKTFSDSAREAAAAARKGHGKNDIQNKVTGEEFNHAMTKVSRTGGVVRHQRYVEAKDGGEADHTFVKTGDGNWRVHQAGGIHNEFQKGDVISHNDLKGYLKESHDRAQHYAETPYHKGYFGPKAQSHTHAAISSHMNANRHLY